MTKTKYFLKKDKSFYLILACRKIHEPAHKADYMRAQEIEDHVYDVEVDFF